ncbi:MAG TPA: hypothetical protein VHQ90_24385 [Thermoanaerobaculia bacterium]|nr:hypothetical protein [Thermoanaerobaculia bacterium]
MSPSSGQQASPPPGLKYFKSAVEELLEGSVYLDTIVTSRRGTKNVALPLPGSSSPSNLTGLQMFGQARRLSIKTTAGRDGLQGAAAIGSTSSSVSLRWVLAPDDEYALPDKQPLPTLFDPGKSQRFTMMDFALRLDEDGRSAFLGFGAGRTYPTAFGGDTRIWLGACGKILSGEGVFANVQGSFALNGWVTPPDGFGFEMLVRVMDPAPGLLAGGPLGLKSEPAASRGAGDPLAGSNYTTFLGEPDPANPIHQDFKPDGTMLGATVSELLRVVRVEYELGNGGKSLRAHHATEDWIAGRLTTKIRFNPFDPKTPGTPESPLPWRTEGTTIAFFDPAGKEIGTVGANVDEGRGFLTRFAGFPAPVLNLVGFGPFAGGTGAFADSRGMLSVNAGVSVAPATLANLYVLRFAAAGGK